jgi:hypothetical protein
MVGGGGVAEFLQGGAAKKTSDTGDPPRGGQQVAVAVGRR